MTATPKLRKLHRYLGVLIGIQFLAWTVSGLYFSWIHIDDIHGDPQMRHPPHLPASMDVVSPGVALEALATRETFDSVRSVELIGVLGTPVYRLNVYRELEPLVFLADAATGEPRPPLTREDAEMVARWSYAGDAEITKVERIESTGKHHEYRAGPLPAYAVYFDDPVGTRVYVAANLGTTRAFRNTPWRVFDFLWMLHTMDYEGRDNFNNLLLRAFSLFGLATVCSGFVLFFATSPVFRRRRAE
ncbi:MAG TPA: PepSY domain-containing protein [Opitutaceae bacterium]|nr:PepSY domain-containing protein [Opitutaceae bacterium]